MTESKEQEIKTTRQDSLKERRALQAHNRTSCLEFGARNLSGDLNGLRKLELDYFRISKCDILRGGLMYDGLLILN